MRVFGVGSSNEFTRVLDAFREQGWAVHLCVVSTLRFELDDEPVDGVIIAWEPDRDSVSKILRIAHESKGLLSNNWNQ